MEQRDRGYRVKTINAILNKKFMEFAATITDEGVQKLVLNNTIITGGCIASLLQGSEVKDYDLYFTNKETVLAVADYYVSKFKAAHPGMTNSPYVLDGAVLEKNSFNEAGGVGLNMTPDRVKIIIKSAGVGGTPENDDATDEAYVEPVAETEEVKEKVKKEKYRPVYLTSNAITLSDGIQMVIRFYGEAADIHKNYDFIHCTNYWTSKDKKAVLTVEALQAIMAKELVYVGSKYPIASLVRTRKFIKRGWVINAGQILKIAFQVSKLDLSNIAVLEDQLVGVDVAYFNMLIAAMAEDQANEPRTIDYTYLAELIDKLF